MTWRRSILTGVAILAARAAFLIALHFIIAISRAHRNLKPGGRS
jgi:hypothetical protein